jgi:hypothetical protein
MYEPETARFTNSFEVNAYEDRKRDPNSSTARVGIAYRAKNLSCERARAPGACKTCAYGELRSAKRKMPHFAHEMSQNG